MKLRCAPHRRNMSLEPADLGRKMSRIENDARLVEHQAGIDPGSLLIGAAVHPDEAGMERPPVRSDRDGAVELAGQSERLDIACRSSSCHPSRDSDCRK